MNLERVERALLLCLRFSFVWGGLLSAVMRAETVIPVDAAALANGHPGGNGAPFHFTTAVATTLRVKAMFATHWMGAPAHAESFLKATAFELDGLHYPFPNAPEDFYGFLDPKTWPDRAARRDQQIWIDETILVPAGNHTIEFRNGLMERDTSGPTIQYSFSSWLTASIAYDASKDTNIVFVNATPKPLNVAISPSSQSIVAGDTAVFNVVLSGASDAALSGTDGTRLDGVVSVLRVSPPQGNYTYTLEAVGAVTLSWQVIHADQIWIDTPHHGSVEVTNNLNYIATESGSYTLRALGGGHTVSEVLQVKVPVASSAASLVVTAPIATAPKINFRGGSMVFGGSWLLDATSDGEGSPTYELIAGPGVVAGAVLSASAVGTVEVRARFPATERFFAGEATALIQVTPKPVTFTLADQEFDFDGSSKVARYEISDPAAVSAGMVDASGLSVGPAVNTYPVSIAAHGNYTGSASAVVRIYPRIDRFVAVLAPQPTIDRFDLTGVVQWPARAVLDWSTRNARSISLVDQSGAIAPLAEAGTRQLTQLVARTAGYAFTLLADPLPSAVAFAQAGGESARLVGPSLDVDVTASSSYPLVHGGRYVYTVSARGLSRTATVEFVELPVATVERTLTVVPATVAGHWADRSVDGPYEFGAADFPTWTIQTGETIAADSEITATRQDDGAAMPVAGGSTVLPGNYRLVASFVPPNGNYSAATVSAAWSLTAAIQLSSSHARVTLDGRLQPAEAWVRVLPGTVVHLKADPEADYDWGMQWDSSHAEIWTGSAGLIPDASQAEYSIQVPAGRADLKLRATAYQLGPAVTEFTPLAASFTVASGPAAGQTYARSWTESGNWCAYLGRDGVAFRVTASARESAIATFEIEAKAPGREWMRLAIGAPDGKAARGPRVSSTQTFSAKLGETRPDKPFIPADSRLAGKWRLRARAQSAVGTWSSWSPEQSLEVRLPLRTVTKQGRTLPPVKDSAWFAASPMKPYVFNVWLP